MYLRANEYVYRHNFNRQADEDTINPLFNEIVSRLELEDVIDKTGFAGISIDVPMGYWRKANQIHRWFVENVQQGEDDCGDYYVGSEQLSELLELCKKVQADHSLAEELLPSASGFFFGGTDYDEWYYNDITNTIAILEEALEDEHGDFYYSSSW